MTILKNQLIKDYLYYKIGGTVKYLLKCESAQDIEDALYFIHQNDLTKYLVIGLGSNLLMPDGMYDGAVLLLGKKDTPQVELLAEDKIKVYAGEELDTLINFAFENNLLGLEWAGGLPSTVGGAIRGNAGAFGGETKDSIEKVELLELSNDGIITRSLSYDECVFAYRHSFIKDNPQMVITSAIFKLKKGTNDEIGKARKVYKDHIEYRNINHPMQYPSCGSVFKNIREKDQVEKIISIWPDTKNLVDEKWHGKFSMGYIIKRFGLAGVRVGGAQISEDHANYIVNVDNAKYTDVVDLIGKISDKFKNTFGFLPEPELQIVK